MNDRRRSRAAAWQFFRSGFSQWDTTAAFFPSSQWLVDALVRSADIAEARTIVELGPGIGTVTRGILDTMRDDATLYSIEIDPKMLEQMKLTLGDEPRLRAIEGDAAQLRTILADHGCEGPVDAVISSIGMSLLDGDIREAVFRGIRDVLPPGARYVQYGYLHARVIAWRPAHPLNRFNLGDAVARHFANHEREIIFRNLPPAAVYACWN